MKVLVKSQESYVINGCHAAKYLRLERGAKPLALEILFTFIKLGKNINGTNIFNYEYLYIAYVDYTASFLKNESSVKNGVNDIKSISNFSALCANLGKYEIAGIGVLKNVNVALGGRKNINVKV